MAETSTRAQLDAVLVLQREEGAAARCAHAYAATVAWPLIIARAATNCKHMYRTATARQPVNVSRRLVSSARGRNCNER